jgi:hypothetical protein
MMSDSKPKSLERDAVEMGSWMTTELDLDLAEKQARQYAVTVNASRMHRSDHGVTEEEKEISKSTLDWLKRKKRGRNLV